MGGAGAGKVDDKVLRKYAEEWGSYTPEKRAQVIKELTRETPAKYREMVEEYIKSLNRIHGFKN